MTYFEIFTLSLLVLNLVVNVIMMIALCNFVVRLADILKEVKSQLEDFYYVSIKRREREEKGLVDLR